MMYYDWYAYRVDVRGENIDDHYVLTVKYITLGYAAMRSTPGIDGWHQERKRLSWKAWWQDREIHRSKDTSLPHDGKWPGRSRHSSEKRKYNDWTLRSSWAKPMTSQRIGRTKSKSTPDKTLRTNLRCPMDRKKNRDFVSTSSASFSNCCQADKHRECGDFTARSLCLTKPRPNKEIEFHVIFVLLRCHFIMSSLWENEKNKNKWMEDKTCRNFLQKSEISTYEPRACFNQEAWEDESKRRKEDEGKRRLEEVSACFILHPFIFVFLVFSQW